MQGYDEILYVIGAMIIFSMLTLQVNQMFIKNESASVDGEIEYNAIAVAQDFVDRIKWMTDDSELTSLTNKFPREIEVPAGSGGGTLPYYVEITFNDVNIPDSNVDTKHVFITVRSKFLGDEEDATEDNNNYVKMDFIKSFVPGS